MRTPRSAADFGGVSSGEAPIASGAWPLLGHAPALAARRLRLLERLRGEGPVLRLRLGATPAYLVNDGQLVRTILTDNGTAFVRGRVFLTLRQFAGNGLATSEGPKHLRQRRMVQPVLHREHPGYDLDAVCRAVRRHAEAVHPPVTLDIARQMHLVALSAATTALFSSDRVLGDLGALRERIAVFMRGAGTRAVLPGTLWPRLPLPANRRFNAALTQLDHDLYATIAAFRTGHDDRHDILTALLGARDLDGRAMSDTEVRDQLVAILVGAGDTTSAVMAWAFHEIARHDTVEQRLRTELHDVLGDSPVTPDDVPRLTYTRCVVQEALRLHHPAWLVTRRTTAPTELGGITLPSGADVLFSLTSLFRDPALYPDPARFDPDRWRPDTVTAVDAHALFMPFGLGRHICLGQHLAQQVTAMAIASWWARHRLRPLPGCQVSEIAWTTLLSTPMPMTIEPA